MRLASDDEFVRAAENAGIRIVDDEVCVGSARITRVTWQDTTNYVVLAKTAFETVAADEQFLFFNEYGIWPSSENRYLFSLVMKAWLNVDVTNPTQYVHFSSQDRNAAITLLQIGLQSGWGGLLLGGNNNWFFFNHDGLGLIESALNVEEMLGSLPGVKIVSPAR
jgi:hypothetical protein